MIEVEVNNGQDKMAIDISSLKDAIYAVLMGEGIRSAYISLALVADETMHELNVRFLQHDETTDVLSFPMDSVGECFQGEIVANAEMAMRVASRFDWTSASELMLYVVHGILHLAGYDDQTIEARNQMRKKEREYLAHFELLPVYNCTERQRGKQIR